MAVNNGTIPTKKDKAKHHKEKSVLSLKYRSASIVASLSKPEVHGPCKKMVEAFHVVFSGVAKTSSGIRTPWSQGLP